MYLHLQFVYNAIICYPAVTLIEAHLKTWKKIALWLLGILFGVPVALAILGSFLSTSTHSPPVVAPGGETTSPKAQTNPVGEKELAKVAPRVSVPVKTLWMYRNNKDEMTGVTTRYATLKSMQSLNFAFPYNGANHPELTLRTNASGGYEVLLEVAKGQFICPYKECAVMVRFDDGKQISFSAERPSDHSSTALFLSPASKFVKGIRAASVTRIEATFYQEGNSVLKFDSSGLNWK